MKGREDEEKRNERKKGRGDEKRKEGEMRGKWKGSESKKNLLSFTCKTFLTST